MEMMEIILLVAGGIIFILSFFIPDKKGTSGNLGSTAEKEVGEIVRRELESLREHVDDVVEESVTYAMEKTERSLERLCNEKIMAVNEYSDTVLAEIHKNHEETVFLYDMLNNKHTSLKNTVAEVNKAVKAGEETFHSLEQLMSATSAHAAMPAEESAGWGQAESLFPEAAESGLAAHAEQEPDETWQEEGDREQSNNEKILRLYKKGKSAVMIARELGLGIGEVRLVIDLYRNQS